MHIIIRLSNLKQTVNSLKSVGPGCLVILRKLPNFPGVSYTSIVLEKMNLRIKKNVRKAIERLKTQGVCQVQYLY